MSYESKNPKIVQAVDQLRNEPHSEVKVHDALAAMRLTSNSTAPSRRRKFLLGSVPAGIAVVAVVGFAFYPKGKADFAWAQAIEKSEKATRVHQIFKQNGMTMCDIWFDNGKYALEMKKANGKEIAHIYRRNGKKAYVYFGGSETWQTRKVAPYQFVRDLKNDPGVPLTFVGMQAVEGEFPIKDHALSSIYKLEKSSVKSEESMLDGREVVVISGKLINPPKGRLSDMKIYADRSTHYVLRMDNVDGQVTTTLLFEYPDSIDQKLFEPLKMPNVPFVKTEYGGFGAPKKADLAKLQKIKKN